ncbi:MAG: hypothetical protein HC787_09585 [Nostocaceae cyanobacterium CSU_2_110]|nr:hypothetical protein [Nostocaceae cyanobacterium CSU_2_110]
MPQNDTYLRQIQSNLNKKKVNGRKLKTVSFAEIRKVITEEFPSVDYEAMTKQEKESIVAYIHEQRVKTVNTIERYSNANNSDSYNIELAAKMESQEIENPQVSSDIEKNLSEIEKPLLSSEIESNSSAMEVADASTELITTQPTELSVTKTDNNSVTKTDINQLAPHEAITLIQEIASDDTSRNKQVASQLLTQLDNKTDSIVALVAAMPDIEAEMLRRKLKEVDRKEVDYEAIIGSHFRESTTELTNHISNLAAEYGVTL